MDFWSTLFPIVLGIGTKYIFAGTKSVVRVLDKAPAPVQQMGVLGVAAGVTWASQWVPGLDQVVSMADPTMSAGIAAATAFGIHRPKVAK